MRSFELSNPTLLITGHSDSTKQLIKSKLKIKLSIQGIQLTSHISSSSIEENQIFWGQTFMFEQIPLSKKHIVITLIKNQEDVVLTAQEDLNFDQGLQIIKTIRANGKKIQGTIQLTLKHQFIKEKIKQSTQEIDMEDIAKKFVTQVKRNVVNNSQQQKHAQNNTALPLNSTIQHKVGYDNTDSQKRRQTLQQLQFDKIFTKQKQKAMQTAKQFIKKLQLKVQKRIQEKKQGQSLELSSKRQTHQQPKQSQNDKNKQNKDTQRQRISKVKTPQWTDQQTDFRSFSPKDSVLKQSSLRGSMLKDKIKMSRSKYGDKIYQNQSAVTMQKSILCFSVPKGPRFRHLKYNGVEPSYYVGTSFSSKNKGTSFGYGTRKPYPQWMVRNMNQNPAPNLYTVTSPPTPPTCSSKGFSFGIPYHYYQKTTIVGTQCSKRDKTPSTLPKLKQNQKSSLSSVSLVDSSNHYHYRNVN